MNQRGFVPVLILLVIALVAVVGGGYYFLLNNRQTRFTQERTSPAQAPQSDGREEAAGWKTYAKYTVTGQGIEFKYPSDWFLADYMTWSVFNEASPRSIISIGLDRNPLPVQQPADTGAPIQIDLNTCNKDSAATQSEFKERVARAESDYTPETLKVTTVLISGKEATQMLGVVAQNGQAGGQYFKETLMPLSRCLLTITLTGREFEQTYDKIISTFKAAD